MPHRVVGVASRVTLYPVRVFDATGSGSWESVICGIDWVTANARNPDGSPRIQVANLSLAGGGASDGNCGRTSGDVLHLAICNSRDDGVVYVAGAGNGGADAAGVVPAGYHDAAIAVSGLVDTDGRPGAPGPGAGGERDDDFLSWSNHGAAVDLAAPSHQILSTYPGGGYAELSGTSMAAPHVAGAVALDLQRHPGATWTQVRDGLRAAGEALSATCRPSALDGCHGRGGAVGRRGRIDPKDRPWETTGKTPQWMAYTCSLRAQRSGRRGRTQRTSLSSRWAHRTRYVVSDGGCPSSHP